MLASLTFSAALVVPRGPMCTMQSVTSVRSAIQPIMIAKTPEERALLESAKKVTSTARKFGYTQGQAAQLWVEKALETKDASTDALMEMQLTLFDECSVDDESGRCKALSEAIDAMKAAVAAKSAAPVETKKKKGFRLNVGPSELQKAADKVRAAATRFGPTQKAAANDWIKSVTAGTDATYVGAAFRDDLLTQKITLFGECLLSEDGTPSDCEALEAALSEFAEAVEFCEVASAAAEEACRAVEVAKQLQADFEAGKVVSWFDRGVRLQSMPEAPKAAAAPAAAAAPSAGKVVPTFKEDPPTAEEAVETLKLALRRGTAGRDKGSASSLKTIEAAIEAAESAGADAEKLRVARDVVAKRGRYDRAVAFW